MFFMERKKDIFKDVKRRERRCPISLKYAKVAIEKVHFSQILLGNSSEDKLNAIFLDFPICLALLLTLHLLQLFPCICHVYFGREACWDTAGSCNYQLVTKESKIFFFGPKNKLKIKKKTNQ